MICRASLRLRDGGAVPGGGVGVMVGTVPWLLSSVLAASGADAMGGGDATGNGPAGGARRSGKVRITSSNLCVPRQDSSESITFL
ncbi:hypothetical protein AA12717_0779 [Gluconacetobacter sacchari DSM 12717]|uniref:Secreted protein n=1 Tax=Gluconacetobacter sacchari DSM 12717 TaxID=1307940 RepID=A0ABQ0P419_9PROT|nr:hypothetical protein AA12717_0779 [Gluconacetobacter sacchari DSM 12717]